MSLPACGHIMCGVWWCVRVYMCVSVHTVHIGLAS